MKYRTWLELSRKNLHQNISIIKKIIGYKTGIIAVVKANAYGHGLIQMSSLLKKEKIDILAVVELKDAETILKKGIKIPILILGPLFNFETDRILNLSKKGVIFTIYDFDSLKLIKKIGKKLKRKIKIHLKIDSGMGRLGFLPNNALLAYKTAFEDKFLEIDGIYSHFYGADEKEIKFDLEQIKIFKKLLKDISKFDRNIFDKKIHFAKSAALRFNKRLKEIGCNFIRVGLSIYGLNPFVFSRGISRKLFRGIQPILSLKSRVGCIKWLPKGHCVSYGCTFITKKPTKIAVIPVGYFEGIDRRFSNNSFVLVKGKYAKILGRVCMNLIIVDISNIKDVRTGDKVIVIDNRNESKNSVNNLAKRIGTINYEIVTRLNPQLPRIIVD